MQLETAQMVHQWRFVLNPPITILLFDKTVMLCGAAQDGDAPLFDTAPDFGRVDVGNGAGEIAPRTPGS
jgi:hypothetical protein